MMNIKNNYLECDEKFITRICKDLVKDKQTVIGTYWFQAIMSFIAQNDLRANVRWTGVNYVVELV